MSTVANSKEMDLKKMEKLPIIDPSNPGKKFNEKEEKWLREVKTYEFTNLEQSGLMLSFPYGSTKNKMQFTFFHGGKYKLPRFIANHVNSRGTPNWGWKPDGMGSMVKHLSGRKNRFQLQEAFE